MGHLESTAAGRVARVAAAHTAEVDRDGRFPAEAVAAMREEGLLGSLVPAAFGGHGAGLAEVAGHLSRIAGGCASSAMILAMHHIQVACIVRHAAHDPWHAAFLRRIAGEQLLLASITSEVGIGGDMRTSACAVERADGRFTLGKRAPTVSYGAHADAFLVTARRAADAAPSDQVLVTALREDSRLERTGGWDAMGMRGTCSEGFVFAGEGETAQIMAAPFADIAADTMVPVSHLLWGAAWTGIAADAVTRARSFLRKQAKARLGAVPAGAPRLVQAIGLVQAMEARLRPLLRQYDAAHGHGADPAAAAAWPGGMVLATTMNLLKHDLSEMAHQAVHQALLICGMAGYRNGTDQSVGRHPRDIYSAQLMISNDRIAQTTGALLIAQRSELGTL